MPRLSKQAKKIEDKRRANIIIMFDNGWSRKYLYEYWGIEAWELSRIIKQRDRYQDIIDKWNEPISEPENDEQEK